MSLDVAQEVEEVGLALDAVEAEGAADGSGFLELEEAAGQVYIVVAGYPSSGCSRPLSSVTIFIDRTRSDRPRLRICQYDLCYYSKAQSLILLLVSCSQYLEDSNQMFSQSGRRSPTWCSNATDSTATVQRQPMHYLVSA
jgi:hypothetical protein